MKIRSGWFRIPWSHLDTVDTFPYLCMLTDILYATPGLHLSFWVHFHSPLLTCLASLYPDLDSPQAISSTCFHVDAVLTCHQSVDTDVTHFSMLETIN